MSLKGIMQTNSRVPEWLMLFAYAGAVLAATWRHEPWSDEAQAWLIARDLGIGDIFKQMAYEGSPALWHLLLAPFAKAGLPFECQLFLHAFIAIGAAAIFLFKSPFQRWQKFAFVFSLLMVFEYAVVSRNYGIGLLFLFIAASMHHVRFQRPILYAIVLFLLINTSSHAAAIGLTLAGIMGLEALIQKRLSPRVVAAGAIMFAAGLALAIQIKPAEDNVLSHVYRGSPAVVFRMFKACFFPDELIHSQEKIFGMVGMAFFALFLWHVRRSWQMLVLLILPTAGWLYIHMVRYEGGLRHWGFIVVVSVVVMWIAHPQSSEVATAAQADGDATDGDATDDVASSRQAQSWLTRAGGVAGVVLFACLFCSIPQGARCLKRDFFEPFSGSRAMAAHIREAGYQEPIATLPGALTTSPLVYLPDQRFWITETKEFRTFNQWDTKFLTPDKSESLDLTAADASELITAQFGDQPVLLLTIKRFAPKPGDQRWELLHEAPCDVWPRAWSGYAESFLLYRHVPSQ